MIEKIKYALLIMLLAPLAVQAAGDFVPPPPDEVFEYEIEARPGHLLIH